MRIKWTEEMRKAWNSVPDIKEKTKEMSNDKYVIVCHARNCYGSEAKLYISFLCSNKFKKCKRFKQKDYNATDGHMFMHPSISNADIYDHKHTVEHVAKNIKNTERDETIYIMKFNTDKFGDIVKSEIIYIKGDKNE